MKQDRIRIVTDVTEDMCSRIDAYASKLDMPRSRAMVVLLNQALDASETMEKFNTISENDLALLFKAVRANAD